MVFEMDNGKKRTISLADPKESLTQNEVETVMNTIIGKDAIIRGTTSPEGICEAVIREVTDTQLI